MHTLSNIRDVFLNYFQNNGHTHVPSSPVVPQNDPTLMFTNAGMVPFKDVFTGKDKRDYVRATSAQKCIRAGGKHNDLDNVGYTARHHTFFEMLGNFSFGDYFKEQAIKFAWDVLTKEFSLPAEKLVVTVYAEDTESALIWKKITGFSDDKIIKINTNDNFWSMGDVGPCGPCTEIFYDHGEEVFGGLPGTKDQDGDRFIEIWNIVFMQYEQLSDGTRLNLQQQSVDTGMGLERIAAVLQGVHNNYDIDLFKNLIQATQNIVGNKGARQSYNIIADHLRSCSFMIADGVTPSNEGRGYVLRRIMRRAMRHAHLLGAKQPLMHQLVSVLTATMGSTYSELMHAQNFIEQTFKIEEEKFRETLSKGLKLLEDAKSSIHHNILPGDIAFKLYDTYGFPLDLTQDILRADNTKVDIDGFDQAMLEQKERAKKSWSGSGAKADEAIYFDIKQTVPSTEFLGYASLKADALITSIIIDGKISDCAKTGDQVEIICNQTPFYAESGGQVGDIGMLETDTGIVEVSDCIKKFGTHFFHKGRVIKGTINTGTTSHLSVDDKHRAQVAANHSATHLLHAALRSALGQNVVQKGSLVDANRLRFDFTHNQAVTEAEIKTVESLVNNQILNNHKTVIKLMTPSAAIESGAMALFGEKYDDEVRVVSIGENSFSTELCGGTHVGSAGNIGLFKIISEGSVASGVRRIEAISGNSIIEYTKNLEAKADQLAKDLKEETLLLNKEITKLKQQLVMASLGSVDITEIDHHHVHWGMKNLKDVPAKDLRPIAEQLIHKQNGKYVLVLTSVENGKVSLIIATSKGAQPTINASSLIKNAVEHLGGQGGGGRPDMAQGGGTKPENISSLLKHIMQFTQ
jgi:alanyl-tRNA synthetase